jgi:serine phosphatase RsbU (regulator of sigma subunit)
MATAGMLSLVGASTLAPCAPSYGFAGFSRSAMEVGGDLFDVVPLDENSTLLVMADVMGKGLPASLFAASLRTLVRALAKPEGQPVDWLTELNDLMFEQLSNEDVFITAQLVLADFLNHELRVANAGHCPLLISDGVHHTRAIAPEGMPLGIQRYIFFSEERVRLQPFSSTLLYTDGVTEAQDDTGSFFGQARLEQWLHGAVANGFNSVQLKQSLLQELVEFQGTSSPADDQTFLILSDETPRSAGLLGGERLGWLDRMAAATEQKDTLSNQVAQFRAA